jgi:hypothetical protein
MNLHLEPAFTRRVQEELRCEPLRLQQRSSGGMRRRRLDTTDNQNELPGWDRNAISSEVDILPRMALRCGKRPKRSIMSLCDTA